jgi:hypothetical protein
VNIQEDIEMTEVKRFTLDIEGAIRDMTTMLESIRLDRLGAASRQLTPEERDGILQQAQWCRQQLEKLRGRLLTLQQLQKTQ